jgi:hypothetical protein
MKNDRYFCIFSLLMGSIILIQGACAICPAHKIGGEKLSTFDGKPDLVIVDIVGEYYVDGPTLKCVIQNVGTAPSADYELQVDGYIILGLLHVYNSYNHGFPLINAGETKYVECGCPNPFVGIIRLHCYVSTSIPEENYTNNHFAHSYFIVNIEPFWFFKE